MAKKRIFVGIPVEESLSGKIVEWRNKNFVSFSVRNLPEENLHVTLVPPWKEDKIDDVFEKLLAKGKSIASFEIVFEKVSFGPSAKHPRLIWAQAKTSAAFINLKNEIYERLGFPSDIRFTPHLTLARFREGDFARFSIQKMKRNIFWKLPVNSICLYESKLGRSGAIYTKLESVLLYTKNNF